MKIKYCTICGHKGDPQKYPIVSNQEQLICLGCYIAQKEKERNFRFTKNMIRSSARNVFQMKDEDNIDAVIERIRGSDEADTD